MRAHGATILLLEDDDMIRKMAEEYIGASGYRVISAGDGDEMLRLAALEGGRIDMLVTDFVLPGKNGRDVAEALRRNNPLLPVVFMSGYTDDAVTVEGALAMNVAFLQKPFGLEILTRKIRELLDRPAVG